MKMAHARFLSDTTLCPMMTSKSTCRSTVPESGSVRKGPDPRSGSVLRLDLIRSVAMGADNAIAYPSATILAIDQIRPSRMSESNSGSGLIS